MKTENIDLLNDVIVKKIFTRNEDGKRYVAKIISNVLETEIESEDLEQKNNREAAIKEGLEEEDSKV